jgi:hypothetical protein
MWPIAWAMRSVPARPTMLRPRSVAVLFGECSTGPAATPVIMLPLHLRRRPTMRSRPIIDVLHRRPCGAMVRRLPLPAATTTSPGKRHLSTSWRPRPLGWLWRRSGSGRGTVLGQRRRGRPFKAQWWGRVTVAVTRGKVVFHDPRRDLLDQRSDCLYQTQRSRASAFTNQHHRSICSRPTMALSQPVPFGRKETPVPSPPSSPIEVHSLCYVATSSSASRPTFSHCVTLTTRCAMCSAARTIVGAMLPSSMAFALTPYGLPPAGATTSLV